MQVRKGLLIFVALGICYFSAFVQELPLDPAIRKGRLPNGFTYYIKKNTEPKLRAQLYLVIKAGSILETDAQLGLAHFTEHMSFNGTKNFPKNALVDYLQKSGVRFGADLNAYTSFDETVYQLPIPTDDVDVFKNGMQIMRDWAGAATMETGEINKERGVILEEKRLGKGAKQRMSDKYLPVLLNNSRYSKRLPIGTEEVLKNFRPSVIKQFYNEWYRPSLQALIVVGDIDVDAIEKMIKAKFADLKDPAVVRPRTKYNVALTGKNQFIAVSDKEFPYTVAQVIIKHPGTKLKTRQDYRESIKRALFNQMLGARYDELAQQADLAFVQGGASIEGFLGGLDNYGALVVAKPGELEKGFKAIWMETERARRFGFTSTELGRAKQSYLAGMETSVREKDKTLSERLVQEYTRHFLNEEAAPGILKEFELVKELLPGITLDELNAVAKQYIKNKDRDVVIMAGEGDKGKLPTEVVVNEWMKEVESSSITAYTDIVDDKPLLATAPVSGKIVDEKYIAELDVTELMLSNGVKVVLKPTDFRNDQVLFNSFSPGGSSLYSDEDFQSAANAATIIDNSGVGDFSAVQLSKMLTGKIVSVTPYISERSEGVQGSASPKDLETAMQLTYLYFTKPRRDSVLFNNFITRSKAAIANRSNDPVSVFTDTVNAVLGNHHIRRTGPTVKKLEQVLLDKAYTIYKDRFADANDFTFTFTGSFDKEKIKPLLEEYLGSLPSLKRGEQARDLGIRTPKGKIEQTVYKGSAPKATVRLVFSGDYVYGQENNIQLDGLAEVLNIKLVERLRELEGGVYSPSVRAGFSKFPVSRYSVTIVFGCAPENVEKLISATLDEIGKLRSQDAGDAEVQKFIAEEKRITETQLMDNKFWSQYLSGSYQNNDDPKSVLRHLELLKSVTAGTIRKAAGDYLSGENMIRLVLMPEK